MSKQEPSLIKTARDYIYSFFEGHGEGFVYHNYSYISENIKAFREIAKAEDVGKQEYEMAQLAVAFKDVGLPMSDNRDLDNQSIIDRFLGKANLSAEQLDSFNYFLGFLKSKQTPKNKLEQVLRDSIDIHLAHPDALEWINLLRIEREKLYNKTYNDIKWMEICKRYYLTHSFFTRYAKTRYGVQRNKNFYEIERLLYRMKSDLEKQNRAIAQDFSEGRLTFRETEDLFKIAFRNYVDLVSVADSKAGLMIQVNSILATVVIAFSFRYLERHPVFIIPTALILVVALGTIFFAILASRPQEEVQKATGIKDKDAFFFGSFDRIDDDFRHTQWDDFKDSMQNIVNGTKEDVYRQVSQETFMVRKVLAQKFRYISIAYKVFMYGLIISTIAFLATYLVLD